MKIIPTKISDKLGHQLLVARKESPKAMFILGIGGVIVSTVLACRATLKLDDTLEKIEDNLHDVKNGAEDPSKKDLVKVYVHATADIVKLYGPSVLVGAASISALTASHVTLQRRNAGLTAAYAGLQTTYEAYRERVRKELGEEKERDIFHNVTTETVEIDGKKVKVKVKKEGDLSEYYKVFEESNPEWQVDPEYNRSFLLTTQTYLNQRLQTRGHMFLNEVYEALGFDHTSAGAVVGWVYRHSDETPNGDNYIDFGMFQVANERHVNHGENYFILDFNVDGVIFDKIGG